MTINELLGALRKVDQDLAVHYDFCGLVPTRIDSYRGHYAMPALGWASQGTYPRVSELIEELEFAISGQVYFGWKGGEYKYNGDETLYVDNTGESSDTKIVFVHVGKYSVILRTRGEEL